jgi:SagB-type dehydrogenase family enzyme
MDLSIDEVARILVMTQAITARSRGGGTDFWFRSAASAGALYPTEIYLASRSVAGLEDGIYHYSAFDHRLAQIRQGSFVNLDDEAEFRVVFFFTAIFFRSSWKYRDRAYRYSLLDTGHVLENHILALKAMDIPYRIHYDFQDREVNHLLGIEDGKEATLVMVDIPGIGSLSLNIPKNDIAPLPSQIAKASRVARVEKDYDLLRQFNESCFEVRPHSAVKISDKLGLQLKPVSGIIENNPEEVLFDYPEVLFQRRSKRNFVDRAMSPSALAKISAAMMAESYPYVAPGMLIGTSEAMPSGLYVFDQESRKIYRAAEGSFHDAMADICLHQMWIATASIHFVFLSNLDIIDASAGPRGYRYAMISAGRMGQRLYLAATALGIGCCGIGAFYDRDAAELLGLDEESRMLYLVAVGSIKK